jgi:hypothetical protein
VSRADCLCLLVVADHAGRSRGQGGAPTGRATLTLARTGAGSADEKVRDDQPRGSRPHPFRPPSWEDPHDVPSGSGCLSQSRGRLAGACQAASGPDAGPSLRGRLRVWVCLRTGNERASSLRGHRHGGDLRAAGGSALGEEASKRRPSGGLVGANTPPPNGRRQGGTHCGVPGTK